MRYTGRLAVFALVIVACVGTGQVGTRAAGVKSQLRGYDLGPPFPAGLRGAGLVDGYAEGEWVPFVAVVKGKKLADADELAGTVGDGVYVVSIIFPTYSPHHNANAIMDLVVTGTYGEGGLTPIPDPFDDKWLVDHGYSPFVLGAYTNTGEIDSEPMILSAVQHSGPTRFSGDVASGTVTINFEVPPDSEAVELLFAVRLAAPDLAPIAPDGQSFPGVESGEAKGAADFFPGPGPIFVGYQVNKPTGIAIVPIRVNDAN